MKSCMFWEWNRMWNFRFFINFVYYGDFSLCYSKKIIIFLFCLQLYCQRILKLFSPYTTGGLDCFWNFWGPSAAFYPPSPCSPLNPTSPRTTCARVCVAVYTIQFNLCLHSLESAGDGGFMVIGLSGSLGDGDGSRLVSMAPTPPVCKCWIGCIVAGGGGERRPLTPGINAPAPWWLGATMVPWFTPLPPAVVPFCCWSPSTGNPFSDRNSSRSQYCLEHE